MKPIPVPDTSITSVRSIPVPDTQVSSVRHGCRYRTLRSLRYDIKTCTGYFNNFGTISVPGPDTYVSSVRHLYRYEEYMYRSEHTLEQYCGSHYQAHFGLLFDSNSSFGNPFFTFFCLVICLEFLLRCVDFFNLRVVLKFVWVDISCCNQCGSGYLSLTFDCFYIGLQFCKSIFSHFFDYISTLSTKSVKYYLIFQVQHRPHQTIRAAVVRYEPKPQCKSMYCRTRGMHGCLLMAD